MRRAISRRIDRALNSAALRAVGAGGHGGIHPGDDPVIVKFTDDGTLCLPGADHRWAW